MTGSPDDSTRDPHDHRHDDRHDDAPEGAPGDGHSARTRPAAADSSAPVAAPGRPAKPARRRPGQLVECGWCGQPIRLARVGRTPKWCSDSCRHRAWETRRALASETAPVRVVDRTIEVAVTVPVIEQVQVTVPPKGARWAPALTELAHQIDTGKLYDRDLPALAAALSEVANALTRRPGPHHYR